MEIKQQKKIQKLQSLLRRLDRHSPQIGEVMRLETPTQFTPQQDRAGYWRDKALTGFQCLLEAYEELDTTLTTAQQKNLTYVRQVLASMEPESNLSLTDLKQRQSDKDSIVHRKITELNENGCTFIASGHREHANIVRIKKIKGGTSYTLYDAGDESGGGGFYSHFR